MMTAVTAVSAAAMTRRGLLLSAGLTICVPLAKVRPTMGRAG